MHEVWLNGQNGLDNDLINLALKFLNVLPVFPQAFVHRFDGSFVRAWIFSSLRLFKVCVFLVERVVCQVHENVLERTFLAGRLVGLRCKPN